MFINNKHQSNTKNLRIFNRIFHDIPRLRFFIWLGRRKFRWQFRWKIEKHRQKTCGNEMPWGDGWPIFLAMMPWPPLNRHDAMMLWLLWKMDEYVYSNVIYPIITYKKYIGFLHGYIFLYSKSSEPSRDQNWGARYWTRRAKVMTLKLRPSDRGGDVPVKIFHGHHSRRKT